MFLLITRVLLWLLVGLIIYYVLLQLIPKNWLAVLGGLLIFALVILAFFNPDAQLVSPTWSLLSIPFKPVGLSILLLFLGVINIKKGEISTPGKLLISISLLLLLLSSTPFLAYQLAQGTEMEAIRADQLQGVPLGSERATAIVLLGWGTTQANLPYRTQIQLTERGDRILYTAELYNQQTNLNNNPLVIVSAGPRTNLEGREQQRIEAIDIAILLQRLGVPSSQIVLEQKGINLRISALEVQNILKQRELDNQNIILVTSGINNRRAKLTFAHIGIRVISRPTDFYGFQQQAIPKRRISIEDFLPSVDALVITTRVVEELLGSVYYFLRGWLSPVIF